MYSVCLALLTENPALCVYIKSNPAFSVAAQLIMLAHLSFVAGRGKGCCIIKTKTFPCVSQVSHVCNSIPVHSNESRKI